MDEDQPQQPLSGQQTEMPETASSAGFYTDPLERKNLRHFLGRHVKSVHKFIHKKFQEELRVYLALLRNEFGKFLPERVLKMDDVDVNVAFPIIKTLIPSLYFKDPKVLVKADQETIVVPMVDPATGEEIIHPMTGQPVVQEYDGVRSARIFQNALNNNLSETNFKYEEKQVILDAHIGFYGALKCGFGNDQGVMSMGEGAPPSTNESVLDDMAYGIRLKPWDVLVDMKDFYHPEWIAVRYTVHPEQLKKDPRLQNTEGLKGKCEMELEDQKDVWSALSEDDKRQVEYFELYYKPCAKYPNGLYALMTDEVPDDFLYLGEWPYEKAREFPIKLLYFNPDPEGGLPTPDIRYYFGQQKAKSVLRRVAYEYVQRTLPFIAYDQNRMDEGSRQKLASGQIPRSVPAKGNPNQIISAQSFNNLNADFHRFDTTIDADVVRMVGLLTGPGAAGPGGLEFSSEVKEIAGYEKTRTGERADIVSDHLKSALKFWAKLYQEFGADENYTPIEGEKFPVKWGVNELQGKFTFDIKPFSMNYEDPTILRKQWVEVLNLLSSPVLQAALAAQGAQVDYLKIINRVLETYDEKDVENFIIDDAAKPENQVMQALQENEAILQGMPVQVMPTDNHKLHALIHNLLGEAGIPHLLHHNEALLAQGGVTNPNPGGGNPEGLPVNGVAADQEQMTAPLKTNMRNKKTAMSREAKKPY